MNLSRDLYMKKENVSNTNLIDGENIARKKKVRYCAFCTLICTMDSARLNPNANFHASFKFKIPKIPKF